MLSRKELRRIIKFKSKNGGTSTREDRPGSYSGKEVG